MYVNGDRLHNAFKKVRQIREEMHRYCISGDCIPVSVKYILETVERAYGLKIEVRKVAKGGKNVKALVLRQAKGSSEPHVIVVSDQNPEQEVRYVTVKETAHLVNDEEEDWSMDGVSTIKDYYYEMTISSEQPAKPPVQSEAVAEVAAIELLYPFELRVNDIADLAAGKTTLAKLTLHYDLPQPVIGRALSKQYMDLATTVWADVDREASEESESEA